MQLAKELNPLPPEVKIFCDKDAKERRNPTEGERILLLRSICSYFQTTYVFIDALVTPFLNLIYCRASTALTMCSRTFVLKRVGRDLFVCSSRWSLPFEYSSPPVHKLTFTKDLPTCADLTYGLVTPMSKHT